MDISTPWGTVPPPKVDSTSVQSWLVPDDISRGAVRFLLCLFGFLPEALNRMDEIKSAEAFVFLETKKTRCSLLHARPLTLALSYLSDMSLLLHPLCLCLCASLSFVWTISHNITSVHPTPHVASKANTAVSRTQKQHHNNNYGAQCA